MISCNREVITPRSVSPTHCAQLLPAADSPNECHIINANSGTCSRFLLNSIRAASLELPFINSATQPNTRLFSSLMGSNVPAPIL